MVVDTLDFEDLYGDELSGFWVTDEEVAALWSRITTNAANLNVDMAESAATRQSLLPQYERWRSNMMATYVAYRDGGWWNRNFSGTLETAENYQNELAGWQRRYTQTARRPITGPSMETVIPGGEDPADTIEAVKGPLMWIAGIIALVIGFKVYKDLR